MFEDATFHSRGVLPNQAPKWMLLTLALNLAVLAALIVVPLISPEGLTPQFLRRILYTPPTERATVVQHVVTQPITQSAQAPVSPNTNTRLTPTSNPTEPDASPTGAVIDLSPIIGAVPDGIGPSTRVFQPSTPPPAVKSAPSRVIAVSGGVSEGLLISKANPTYPAIARATHTAGAVVLAATISTTGRIENLQVISGPPTLRQAALDAVRTWRYRPYRLNNQPVEVETTINVIFSLDSQ
jgi:periplasmic protein TonB